MRSIQLTIEVHGILTIHTCVRMYVVHGRNKDIPQAQSNYTYSYVFRISVQYSTRPALRT